jgi:hypothetical protein
MAVSALQTRPPRYIDPNAPLAKQQEVFRLLLKDPPENSRIITVTPDFASWLLETYNVAGSNRKRKPARIIRYAEAMGYDGWLLTGEPLIFGKDRLLDGQNRLMACVRSGKSFRTHVAFGIEDNVFTVIDSGKSRTPGDTFFTAGVTSPEIVSPAIRWLMLYENGQPTARTSFSNQEMWNVYCDKKRIDQEILERAVARAKLASKAVPKGALAAHLYLFEKSHAPTAKKLAADFDKNQHGALKFTKMLAKARKDKQIRLQDIWINAVLVQVWNAYRAGRPVTAKDLKWSGQAQEYPIIA